VESVSKIMDRHIVAASANASVGTAIKLMQNANVSVLPVLNGSKLVGIITQKEAEAEVPSKRLGDTRLRLVYVLENDPIEKAAELLVKNMLTRIPVVSDQTTMHCVGIVSATEIAKHHKSK